MEFISEFVFYNPNVEGLDKMLDEASSDYSYRYLSYKLLRPRFNMKIVDMEKNKTKNKVLKYISIGDMSFRWKMRQKEGRYKLIKTNKLTLQYYGNIDISNICFYLRVTLP